MTIAQKLLDLNITLPAVATPAAAYVMTVRSGHTLYVSGHIAKKDGQPWVGKLGKDMTTEQGREAARAVAIDLIATLSAACDGDLDRVPAHAERGPVLAQVQQRRDVLAKAPAAPHLGVRRRRRNASQPPALRRLRTRRHAGRLARGRARERLGGR